MTTTETGKTLLDWFINEVYHPDASYAPKDFDADLEAIEKEAVINEIKKTMERFKEARNSDGITS